MRITSLLIGIQACFATLLMAGTINAQTINLDVKQAKVQQVFSSIEKQSGVTFVYNEQTLKGIREISIKAVNQSLAEVLKNISNQVPLLFKQAGTVIGVSKESVKIKPQQSAIQTPLIENIVPLTITGKVTDEQGNPLPGATIRVRGTSIAITTNPDGKFTLNSIPENSVLIVTYIGYDAKEITAANNILVSLVKSSSKLDEVHVIAYGTTTQRLSTGAVSKVTSEEIEQQPVGNPLAALEGRVPGLTIVQGNGIPGSSFKVQIRGQNALGTGDRSNVNSDPLFIIDGIPFAPNNTNINTIGSALTAVNGQGLSPFSVINPSEIESIEVLKDADATAIYGSRGANGVILITTKKGSKGKTRLSLNVYNGMSKVTNTLDYMNTQQYLQARTQAFHNDGVVPNSTNAPDLTVFDQNSYTDFKKLMLGGTAHVTDAEGSVKGGSENNNFLMSGSYRDESTVFPGDMSDKRGSFHFNMNHTSTDQKFSAGLSASYTYDENNLTGTNPVSNVNLPPNYPALFDANNNLVWSYKGVELNNPFGYLKRTYLAETKNLISNLQLNYKIAKNLSLRSSLGYNTVNGNEISEGPVTAVDPLYSNGKGGSLFGNNTISSWIFEPQAEYKVNISKGVLDVLAGGTWQQNSSNSLSLQATGYTADALLGSLSGATTITPQSVSNVQYRYQAFFGRINYNLADKYLLNITGRRDGSSRFGPDRQFANFGAIGAAWIFSNEELIKRNYPVLSYGKLRASYGITGSDQISDYQYLDTYSPTTYPYQGTSGLYPTKLANADYSWEENKKMEIGLDLGFLNDRVLFSADYFRNRSSNHLINYQLPSQTGFTSVLLNFPAVIQNTGIELTLTSRNVVAKNFKWETSFNITIPENKLVSFPGVESSSYNVYTVGQSLSIVKGYQSLGVNPTTGVFNFNDLNNDGVLNSSDNVTIGNLDPKFYGGINNTFSYKHMQLSFFVEFKKQLGINALNLYYNSVVGGPGGLFNVPAVFLTKSWQNPGDVVPYQRLTATSSSAAYQAEANYLQSNGVYSDASYLRLKTLSFSYSIPEKWLNKLKITGCRIYVQGQNLFTVTNYFGSDPETPSQNGLPPLKTLTAGIQLTL